MISYIKPDLYDLITTSTFLKNEILFHFQGRIEEKPQFRVNNNVRYYYLNKLPGKELLSILNNKEHFMSDIEYIVQYSNTKEYVRSRLNNELIEDSNEIISSMKKYKFKSF